MFTGLVEGTGEVVKAEKGTHLNPHLWLEVQAGILAEGVKIGDSVAVNGCCLTVVTIEDGVLAFDLLAETAARTNLTALEPGRRVNLERAMPADGRYGGHFVTGHIDATGIVRYILPVGGDIELRIGIEPAQGVYLVPKGCIAIDGISLTVGEVSEDEFTVWIIPHTLAMTALRERGQGDRVNLEFDLLAKYAEKILARRNGSGVS